MKNKTKYLTGCSILLILFHLSTASAYYIPGNIVTLDYIQTDQLSYTNYETGIKQTVFCVKELDSPYDRKCTGNLTPWLDECDLIIYEPMEGYNECGSDYDGNNLMLNLSEGDTYWRLAIIKGTLVYSETEGEWEQRDIQVLDTYETLYRTIHEPKEGKLMRLITEMMNALCRVMKFGYCT